MSLHVVTGGAGFMGSALVRRLRDAGHEVRVLDKMSRGKEQRLPEDMLLTHVDRGDIRDRDAVLRACFGADVVWHLAYVQGTQTFYAEPREVIDVALHGIMNVLEGCERSGRTTDLILLSSSEVYQVPPEGMFPTPETVPLSVPDPTNPRYSYGGGKIASEVATLAHSEKLGRAVIVRAHNVYGPDMGRDHVIPQFAMRMAEQVEKHAQGSVPFRIQGSGRETRSFCYIDDCTDGLALLYDRAEDRGIYHLGNPSEEHAIGDVAHMVADWFGRSIELLPGKLPEGSPPRRAPDIAKMRGLGFEPKVSLRDGLQPTLDWYWRNP